MKNTIRKTATVALALLVTASLGFAAESKIGDMMKKSMKGETSLYKQVSLGKASDADAQKLLDYVKILPAETPSKGEKASWDEKTAALVKAVEDVVAKKPNALLALQKAGNCKACHSEHKGK